MSRQFFLRMHGLPVFAALFVVALSAPGAAPVRAEDDAPVAVERKSGDTAVPAQKKQEPKKERAFKADTPERKEVYDRALALAKKLDGNQSLALAYIKNGYGTIKSVEMVEANVAVAVEKCGTENADMKDEINGHFKDWQDKVHPVLKDNRAKMDKALTAGVFKKTEIAEIRSYLGAIDKAAARADADMEKNVLATPESCKGLIESMARTEDTLAGLLADVTWTPPPGTKIPASAEKAAPGGKDAPVTEKAPEEKIPEKKAPEKKAEEPKAP